MYRPCTICGEPGIVDGRCYDHAKACVVCDEPHSNEGNMCKDCAAQEEGAELEMQSNNIGLDSLLSYAWGSAEKDSTPPPE